MHAETIEIIKIISSSIRMVLFSIVSYGSAVFVINGILDKKRSLRALCLYGAGKILTQGVLLGYVLPYLYGDAQWLQTLNASCMLIFSVMTFVMFYITFKADFLKIAIAALIGEITGAFLSYMTLAIINIMEGKEDVWILMDVLQPMDILAFVVSGGMLFFFYHYAAPHLRKFKNYELKHRKIWWAVFVGYTSIASVTVLLGYSNMVIVGAIIALICFAYIGVICFAIIRYQISLTTKQSFMQIQQKITEAHYEAVQGQIHKMEKSQQRVDEQMKEIIRLQDNVVDSERLKLYLAGLRKSYEQIQAGMYCNDWMLDAVLYTQSEMFKSQGIRFACTMQDYERGKIEEEDLVQIVLLLLDFGMRANQGQIKKEVRLKAAAVKNQLVIEFLSGCGKGCRLSRRAFAPYIKKYKGTVETVKEGREMKVTLVLERG